MFLFDNMVVNMNRKNHCRTWWWIIAYTKLVCSIYCSNILNFENLRLFFIQLILTYEVGKCQKQSRCNSLPLLRHCKDPMESLSSPRNIKNFQKSEKATLSQLRWHESPGALYHPLYCVILGQVFWYVTLEAMWYMYNDETSLLWFFVIMRTFFNFFSPIEYSA